MCVGKEGKQSSAAPTHRAPHTPGRRAQATRDRQE